MCLQNSMRPVSRRSQYSHKLHQISTGLPQCRLSTSPIRAGYSVLLTFLDGVQLRSYVGAKNWGDFDVYAVTAQICSDCAR